MTRNQGPHLSRYIEADGGGASRPSTKDVPRYTVTEAPMGTPRSLRIIGIGAGASGLNIIRSLRETLPANSYNLIIYEKNDNVGGTWYENRYPGCRCDVPSHNYQFSWRKNPAWSNFFSPASEINTYLAKTAKEENMLPNIKTSHKVLGAFWEEGTAMWRVNVRDLETGAEFVDKAHFLLDATGILNNWKWPDIEGVQDFRGDLIHTASWPETIDLKDKVVAVIGNGASGIQVLPAIRPLVKKLYHPIRTPTWILPPRLLTMKMMGSPVSSFLDRIEIDEKENFSAQQIEKFKSDPDFYAQFAAALENDSASKSGLILNTTGPAQMWAAGKAREFMTAMLGGDARLCQALIPTYPVGCRRLTPVPGYLESMRAPNVEVVTDKIKRFVAEGIELETGEVLKVDSIICATGFDSSFCPPFPILGRKGNLQDLWAKDTPKSYMSLAVADMPNYFKFLGPNAPIAHGDVFTLSEHIATYVAGIISKCQTEGIKSIAPSQAAVDDFFEHVAAFMPRTAWAGGCRSWYKQGESRGPVTGVHPGSRLHFIDMLQDFRGEDWEYMYENKRQNRFAYLGNGFSVREVQAMKRAT